MDVLFKRFGFSHAHHTFGGPNGQWSIGGDFIGHIHGVAEELAVLHHVVDQSEIDKDLDRTDEVTAPPPRAPVRGGASFAQMDLIDEDSIFPAPSRPFQ